MANEKRLIDANAVPKNKFFLSRPTLDKIAIREVLVNCPTVDAVEVVRCKDCIQLRKTEGGYDWCDLWKNYTGRNDFCSNGERRDNERTDRAIEEL